MSILDEDESKFIGNGERYEYFSKLIHEWLPKSRVVVPNCLDVLCSECVGRKHNLRYGCPICGERYMDKTVSKRIRCVSPAAQAIYRCLSCSSIITSCGDGDVSAVGVSAAELATEDDII